MEGRGPISDNLSGDLGPQGPHVSLSVCPLSPLHFSVQQLTASIICFFKEETY